MDEVVVNSGNCRVRKRGQEIRFSFEVRDDHLMHGLVRDHAGHFFDGHQLLDVRKMKISTFIDVAHTARAEQSKNQIAILKSRTGLDAFKMLGLSFERFRTFPH